MGIFKTVAEGGQIWAHRVRMLRQVFKMISLISLTSSCFVFSVLMCQVPKLYYQAIWYRAKVQFLPSLEEQVRVDSQFWSQITRHQVANDSILVPVKRLEIVCNKLLSKLGQKTLLSLQTSLDFSLYSFWATLGFFLFRGVISRRKQHIEGRRFSSDWKLAFKLRLMRKASFFKIGRLPIIKNSETRHVLVTGGSGSGKTNCFHYLLPLIRQKQQKAVVIDTTGEFISKYYREGKDIIINPYDKRSVSWHPWIECKHEYDYKALAQSFIPLSYKDEDNFWRKAAQEVFSSTLKLLEKDQRLSKLTQLILYEPLEVLSEYFTNTKAGAYIDSKSDKTSASIRAVAASFLECLELFPDTQEPFSIRNWVQNEQNDSWIFIASTTAQRASLTPLISALFSIGMRSLLQLNPDANRRLWFIADELASLHRLMDLETLLTESRKYGGCALLAFQSPAQLDMIYGRHLARIIMGNCDTRIAFAEKDPQIAEEISKSFGSKETKESQEAISYGAHEMRDGVNLSYQAKTTPVVSPTALQSLEINEAYVKLAGDQPITKIKLKYQGKPIIASPYEEPVNFVDSFENKELKSSELAGNMLNTE